MKLDPAVLRVLNVSEATVATHAGGGMSSASTYKIKAETPQGPKSYFMKTGQGKEAEIMFRGEHASLLAVHNAVPSLCPASLGWGKFEGAESGKFFLVTDYLDLRGRSASTKSGNTESLARKLARLHTTPAPIPEGDDTPMFGFPETTCCGDTPQPNNYKESWAEFYAENRLRFILQQSEKRNGADKELRLMVEKTVDKVVPRLIGDKHLNNGKGITPVVVHGDLWSGNASAGVIGGQGEVEELVYDPSAVYGHSEFELGIMKMFGGFGGSFLKEYHEHCPKTEPVAEYEDRVTLYELYHHLNHHALFGGGYRHGAISLMNQLIRKYGKEKNEL